MSNFLRSLRPAFCLLLLLLLPVTSVVSDSVRPHRWQPTRLPHPWDSPGENTGVGCHRLLRLSACGAAQMCPYTHCRLASSSSQACYFPSFS